MSINAGTVMAYLDMDTTGFNSAFDTAASQLSGFTSGGIEGALGSIGAAATTAGRALTTGVTTPLLGVATAAVGVGMSFDASMSNVYGLMSSLDLTESQMEALRETAREMGATTKFSASEAADAMGYMALAGWNDQQVIAGLPGVLNLAAAANMDLAKASDIVTDTMTPFGMAAEEAARAADVFAYAQANSNTTVEGLGEAMKYAAPTADAFGMTLEDTAAAMGVLANAGIKGSQGGTTLNAMLRDMKNNAEDGKLAIGDMSVALTNSDGSYRSYAEIIRDISTATQGMTESERDAALMAIFGDESIKGVLATLKQGPDALDAMTAGMYAAGGAASDMAGIMGDNLKGDLAEMSSGLEEMGIALSDFLTPVIRGGVQWITDLIGSFNGLAQPVKDAIFQFGSVAAAIGPVLLVGGKLVTFLSTLTSPLGLVAGGLALAYEHSSTLQGAVATLGEGFSSFFTALEGGSGILEALKTGLTTMIGEEAVASIGTFLTNVQSGVELIGSAFGTITSGIGEFIGSLIDGEGLVGAWNSATATISAFDWAGLGQTMLTGVTGVFDAAGNWLSGLFQTAMTAAAAIDWNSVGTAIHNGVLSAIDTAGAWLSSLFGFGKTAAEGIDWSGIGTAILNGIGTVLDSAGSFLAGLFGFGKDSVEAMEWGSVGSTILSGVTGVLDTAGTFLSNLFSFGKSAVEGMDWGGIGSTILSGVTGVLDTAGAFLSNLFGFGKSAIESIEWSGVGSTILSGVTGAIDTAGTFLSGAFTAGKATIDGINWDGIGSTIASGVNTYIDTAGTFLSGAFTAAKTTIEGISWADVGSKISSGLSGALDTLGKIGSNIWDTITGWFSDDDEESAQSDAEAMMDGLETGIAGGAGAVAAAASSAASGVSTAMTNVLNLEGGTAIAASWMNGLSAGITTAQATLTTNAQTVADATKLVMDTTFSAANGTTIGTVFMAGISSGLTTSSSTLSSNATTVAAAASYAASQEMSFGTGNGIGMNMVLGMAAGVRSGSGSLNSAIRSVALSAVAAARSTLKINSPSGVFEDEIGAWIPSGVGVGVTKNMQDALGPIEEMRDGMVSMMDGTLSGISLGRPKAPWDGGGYAGQNTININITGDWSVRSDEDRREIINELSAMIDEELRRR